MLGKFSRTNSPGLFGKFGSLRNVENVGRIGFPNSQKVRPDVLEKASPLVLAMLKISKFWKS